MGLGAGLCSCWHMAGYKVAYVCTNNYNNHNFYYHNLIHFPSIISYDNVVVSTIVPKTFFDEETESYMIEVLVCVDMKSPGGNQLIATYTRTYK